MKNTMILPSNYRRLLDIDLLKDKKLALLVNGLSLLIAVPMVLLAPVSILSLVDISLGIGSTFLRLCVMLVGMVAYIFLHELVHGIFIRHFSGVKAHYGFTGLYAYAGSDTYFNKKSYLIIALAPVVFWGVVLAVLTQLVPESWFWSVYFIQICNISGAAGDLYVTVKFAGLPADILVQDSGVAMRVFSPDRDPGC